MVINNDQSLEEEGRLTDVVGLILSLLVSLRFLFYFSMCLDS
jgi:hypothetical protein